MESREIFLADPFGVPRGSVFWSRGNFPTQMVHGLAMDRLRTDFAISYLMSDKMLLAASFYFESPLTRAITEAYKSIFTRGDAYYFIDDNLEDFIEHGRRKKTKSPSSMTAYSDTARIIEYGAYLNGLNFALKRPPTKISSQIRTAWIHDVSDMSGKGIGGSIEKILGESRGTELQHILYKIAIDSAEKMIDFIWDYINDELNRADIQIPESLRRLFRARLADHYCITTAHVLDCHLDSEIGGEKSFAPNLFSACLDAGKSRSFFEKLSPEELIELKSSDVFQEFRTCYFGIIHILERTRPPLDGVLFSDMENQERILVELCRMSSPRYDQPISQVKMLCGRLCEKVNQYGMTDLLQRFRDSVVIPNFTMIKGAPGKMSGRVLILTALELEKEAILAYFQAVKEECEGQDTVYKTQIVNQYSGLPSEVLLFCIAKPGSTDSAAAAARLIERYSPNVVILGGIAAGVKEKDDRFALGDLTVAEQIVGYDIGKLEKGVLKRREEDYRSSYNLLKTAYEVPRGWQDAVLAPRPEEEPPTAPKVHYGVILSGNKVVADSDFTAELSGTWNQAVGLEMESWGVAAAVHTSKTCPSFICIKAISDWAGEDKDDTWQAYCASVSGAFIYEMLSRIRFQQIDEMTQRLGPVPAAPDARRELTGPVAVMLKEKLYDDWEDIARSLGIKTAKINSFPKGQEIYKIIDYVNSNGRIDEFIQVLIGLGRRDLADSVKKYSDGEGAT